MGRDRHAPAASAVLRVVHDHERHVPGVSSDAGGGQHRVDLGLVHIDATVNASVVERRVERGVLEDAQRGMIDAGLGARIFYVAIDGFDTHANQGGSQGVHANLLAQVSGAITAFYKDLAARGHKDRLLVMTFSELNSADTA